MKTNKIFILALIAVFLGSSIPAAIAMGPQALGGLNSVVAKDGVDFENNTQAKDTIRERVQQAREHVAEIRERRMYAKQTRADLRLTFNNAKKEAIDAKGLWLSEKARYLSDGDVTEEDRQAIMDSAKTYITSTIEALQTYLNEVAATVQDSQMSDDKKERILNAIDNHIEDLEGMKNEVEGADSKQELREATKKVQSRFREIKKQAHEYIKHVGEYRLDNILNRIVNVANKLEAQIETLREKGADMSDAEQLLDDLREKIEEAKNAQTFEQQKESVREALKIVKDLIRDVNKARKELRETIKEDTIKVKPVALAYSDEDDE